MKGFRVGDKYRINDLSHTQGGVTVIVELDTGQILEYDNIKYPSVYIRKVKSDPLVKRAWVKDI
jgi:hypothetical protein